MIFISELPVIDTVRFRITEGMLPGQLANWAFTRKPKKDGKIWYVYTNNFEGPFGTVIKTKYYPQDVHMNPFH